jgi:hypothetical protein
MSLAARSNRSSRLPLFCGSSFLFGSIVLALAAGACGPAEGPQGSGPQTPSTTAPSTTAPPATSTLPAASAPTAPSASGTTATKPPVPLAPMKPIAATAMENDLKEIGIDPKALPPLNKLEPEKLRSVMKTFTRALGVQCNHCHDTKDFRAPTPNKKIATHMWNDFTRTLAMNNGGPNGGTLYCDSCHGGHSQFLDRKDLVGLGQWMQENYVDKLKRADKKDHACESCHGDPFEGKILTKRWK